MNSSIVSVSNRSRRSDRTISFRLNRLSTDPHFKYMIILSPVLALPSSTPSINRLTNTSVSLSVILGEIPPSCNAVETFLFSFTRTSSFSSSLKFRLNFLSRRLVLDHGVFFALTILAACVNIFEYRFSVCRSTLSWNFTCTGHIPVEIHSKKNVTFKVFLRCFICFSNCMRIIVAEVIRTVFVLYFMLFL